ncbi:MAG: hypothetical protein KF901_29370 [Myxococcales bacterium]|nr:hypothetical protein [Myxococcales bacterium]
MRDVLTALAKLWKIDEAAKGYDEELRSLPVKMDAMRADVRMLESLLASERAQVEEADALKASRIADLQERREAIARAKSKVSRARTLKEADAAEREIEATRRLMSDREREIAQLGVTVEAKRETLAEREKQLGEALALAEDETKAGEARLAEVREARETVVVGRDELVAALPRRVVKRYEKLRARDKYYPVSIIAEPTCVSCRMAIPAQLFIEIKRADPTEGPVDVEDLPTCPHCHAFLVHRDLIEPPPPAEG